MSKIEAVVLAAGWGQLRQGISKLTERLNGKSLIEHVIDGLDRAGFSKPIVVVRAFHDQIVDVLGPQKYVLQDEQKGTGAALFQACTSPLMNSAEHVLMVCGDVPLISSSTIQSLISGHIKNNAVISFTTLISDNPRFAGYGKVKRDPHDGKVLLVAKGLLGNEVDVNAYCLDVEWFKRVFPLFEPDAKLEISLTTAVQMASESNLNVATHTIENEIEAYGINTLEQLNELQQLCGGRV